MWGACKSKCGFSMPPKWNFNLTFREICNKVTICVILFRPDRHFHNVPRLQHSLVISNYKHGSVISNGMSSSSSNRLCLFYLFWRNNEYKTSLLDSDMVFTKADVCSNQEGDGGGGERGCCYSHWKLLSSEFDLYSRVPTRLFKKIQRNKSRKEDSSSEQQKLKASILYRLQKYPTQKCQIV